jgi:transcriptional regulator with XRE-family HTH domain
MMAMPRHITPSSYVGLQVRHFRTKKGWTQQQLADRLHQLGMKQTGWSQPKIAKLEKGRLTQILVDDVFELAVALDVSPIYLLTPIRDDDGETHLKVWLGGEASYWAPQVREWIRGTRMLLSSVDYKNDEAFHEAQRFFHLLSPPVGDLDFEKTAARWLHERQAGKTDERDGEREAS